MITHVVGSILLRILFINTRISDPRPEFLTVGGSEILRLAKNSGPVSRGKFYIFKERLSPPLGDISILSHINRKIELTLFMVSQN